jgi:NADPH-dependent glutamate synthase beta subunit-like oxidoreductase/coenzyme F420-reducing hydrogenase delta subunit/NAD-dependent dihydropyrimidine dehydrogenase PreA subunit
MWQLRNDAQAKVEAAVKIFLPPCQNKCPIREDIQRTNVLISLLPEDPKEARDGVLQIGDHLYERNPFFTVCGYICGICERECNYKTKGGSIKRRLLKRFLSDTYTPYLKEKKAIEVKKDGVKVAVIGGGPGGLMCAWEMAKRGHDVTVFDNNPKLGGAVRYIPKYRLPEDVLDAAVDSLVRIGGIKVEKNVKLEGDMVSKLKDQGFKAFFVATGTPYPRPLTFGVDKVEWQGMEGVGYGLTMLDEAGRGLLPADYYKGKRVVVIGGGNVAFDAARTAYRLGGKVTVVCLENSDKTTQDGIPADVEEIEGAIQEGIKIVYSRGVRNIVAEKGKFKRIDCPKCTGVFDYKGFNPQFDCSDCEDVEGDVLLITIGQMWDRSLLQACGLFDQSGRLAVDPLTRRSVLREEVFIGGDVRRVGFMVDAMAEGREAAQSMERYLRGMPMQRWGLKRETTGTPARNTFKPEPHAKWTSPAERQNFNIFEIGFTLNEAREEARRCLECGPCPACKACVSVGIQADLPAVDVDETLCSGCGVCVSACNYETAQLVETKEIIEGREVRTRLVSYTDPIKCKACGMCVSACPSSARKLVPDTAKTEAAIADKPGIVCFACKFGYGYCGNGIGAGLKTFVPVVCIGKVDATDILNAFKKGADGVLLLGCGDGDCHFQDGNEEARKRIYLLQKVIESFGIEKERVKVVTSFDPTGAAVSGLVKEFAGKLKGLEPIRV